jgi:hypothetical protein
VALNISLTDSIDNGSPFCFNDIENGRDGKSSKGDGNVYVQSSVNTHVIRTSFNMQIGSIV